jgi:hypothetical protein
MTMKTNGINLALNSLELAFLTACHEVTVRQQEMLPLLATALQVPENEVFYSWALRQCKQHGELAGTDWAFFFHGLECDLKNSADGRFLRIDFGPQGRVDTFTAWGVLQFIMASAPPWPEFAELKSSFAKGPPPPYDPYSGDLARIGPVWDNLEAKGAFQKADPELVAWAARFTTVGPDGLFHVRYPPQTPERRIIDSDVANRNQLSPLGQELVRRQPLAHHHA